MDAGDWATWVGSTAAVVAAVASVAAWRQSRSAVSWRLEAARGGGRDRIVNTGSKPARDVAVRAGSLSSPHPADHTEQAASVGPGEAVPILVVPGVGVGDFAVTVTWRGRFGREERWTYRTH